MKLQQITNFEPFFLSSCRCHFFSGYVAKCNKKKIFSTPKFDLFFIDGVIFLEHLLYEIVIHVIFVIMCVICQYCNNFYYHSLLKINLMCFEFYIQIFSFSAFLEEELGKLLMHMSRNST
jgi:hypothetical protein